MLCPFISTIPTTRVLYGSSRGVETLSPYRFFFLPFPCLEQIEEVEGTRRFLFRVGTRKKKSVIDTVQRSPTTFYFFFFVFPSLHTRPCSQHVVDWRHVFVKKKGRKKGGGGVSDGPWRTFRLLRSGRYWRTGCTVGCILLPYLT